jgi:hypothetical protein
MGIRMAACIFCEIKAHAPEQRVGILSSNDLRDMVRFSRKMGPSFYGQALYHRRTGPVLIGDKEAIRTYMPEIGEGRIIAL